MNHQFARELRTYKYVLCSETLYETHLSHFKDMRSFVILNFFRSHYVHLTPVNFVNGVNMIQIKLQRSHGHFLQTNYKNKQKIYSPHALLPLSLPRPLPFLPCNMTLG